MKHGFAEHFFLIFKKGMALFRAMVLGFALSACTIQAEIFDLKSLDIPAAATSPKTVNGDSVAQFPISGVCADGVKSFRILYPLPEKTVSCVNGEWSTTVDLSSEAEGSISLKTDLKNPQDDTPIEFVVNKDTVRPSVVISSNAAAVTNQSSVEFSLQFSEDIQSLDAVALNIVNATVTQISGSGMNYVVQVTPTSQGVFSLQVIENAILDIAGNGSSSVVAFGRTFDSVAPTVALSSAVPVFTNAASFVVDARFSESVSNFSETGLSVSNASVSNFAGSGDLYTFTLTPSGQGDVGVQVLSATAKDTAENDNTASNSFSAHYDSVAPTLSMSSPATGKIFASGESIGIGWLALDVNMLTSVKIEYSTDNGSTWSDIDAAAANTGVYSWTAPVIDSAQTLLKVTATDKAGNSSEAQAGPFVIDSNLVAPTVTIVPNPAFTGGVYYAGQTVSFNYSSAGDYLVPASAQIEVTFDEGTSWTSLASNQALNGSYTYSVPGAVDIRKVYFRVQIKNSRDEVGEKSSDIFTIDNTPPDLKDMWINDGNQYAITPFVALKLEVEDSSGIFVHLQEIPTTQSCTDFEGAGGVPLTPTWRAWDSTNSVMSLSFQVTPGDGAKKICAWAKDSLNRLAASALVRSIQLETLNIPLVNTYEVYQGVAGVTTAQAGDPITINWSASDVEGLAAAPISFSYTTDGDVWKDVQTQLDINEAGAITWVGSNAGLATTASGTYTFSAPTSGVFRVRGRARDRAGNTSIAAVSESFNTGSWQVYLGSRDRGDGGVGKAVAITSSWATGMFVIHPLTGDFYFSDEIVGIRKLDIRTGLMSTVLKLKDPNKGLVSEAEVFLGPGELSFNDASTRLAANGILDIAFDSKGRFYISYVLPGTDIAKGAVYQLNLSENKIRVYAGGGTSLTSLVPLDRMALSGSIVFDEHDNLFMWDSCIHPINTRSAGKRLLKVSQKPDGTAGSLSVVLGGNCSYAAAVIGADAATTNAGVVVYPQMTSVVPIPGQNAFYLSGYSMPVIKVVNGTVYSTAITGAQIGNVARLSYNKSDGLLYGVTPQEGIFTMTTSLAGNGGETSFTNFITGTYTAGCQEDEVARASACARVSQAIRFDNEGTMFFTDGPGINKPNTTRVRYVNRSGEMQTLIGTRSLFGEGLNRSLVRGRIGSIAYKRSDSNTGLFPKGLYFMEPFGMVMGYVNPASGMMNAKWGDQSAQAVPVVAPGVTATPMSTSISMGVPYSGYNGNFLVFDTNGLPWLRTQYAVTTVTAGGFIEYLQRPTALTYFNMRDPAATPTDISMMVAAGKSNLNIVDRKALFFGGYYLADVSTAYYDTLSEMILLDFPANIITSIMGRTSGVLIRTQPEPISEGTLTSAGHFYKECNDGYANCFASYDKGASPALDRIFYTEKNMLRYIENPLDSSNGKVLNVYTHPDPEKRINNFILNDAKSMIFYLMDGELHCHDLSSGKSWCNDTSLFPYKSSLGVIGSCGNQLTWMDSDTLLVSTCQGEVFKYDTPSSP